MITFRSQRVFASAFLAMIPAVAAQNGWVRWTTNGHYYQAVYRPAGITWTAARAEARLFGADLATITSATENSFVFSLVSDPSFWLPASSGPVRILGPWLGGSQPAGSAEPLGGWSWVSGEVWGYTNWSPSEPNNLNGAEEDHLQFLTLGTTPAPRWNDLTGNSLMRGYVMETNTTPIASAVLVGTGCGQPRLSLTPVGRPLLGSQQLTYVTEVPASVAVIGFGLSARQIGTSRLPLSLSAFGLTGCTLYNDLVVITPPLPMVGVNIALHTLAIPNAAGLLATQVHLQAFAPAPGVNPAGLVASQGVTYSLGNQ